MAHGQNERCINDESRDVNTSRKIDANRKFIFFSNIGSIVLSGLSMLVIVIAMYVQDSKRDIFEGLSTTVVYFVLLAFFGVILAFSIHSLFNYRFKLMAILSAGLVLTTGIVCAEGSICSYGYYRYSATYLYYINSDAVAVCNSIWIASAIAIFVIIMIPIAITGIEKITGNWHTSIAYREKCYKKVAQMHGYLEKGIISQAEYEKAKEQILSKIQ